MPIFEIQDPQGRTMEIDGDHEPTADELRKIFSQAFPTEEPAAPTAPPSQAPVSAPQEEPLTKSWIPEFLLPQERLATPPGDRWDTRPLLNVAATPQYQLLEAAAKANIPGTRLAKAAIDPGKALFEGFTSPENLAVIPAGIAAPEIVGPAFAAMAIPSVVQGAKNAYAGFKAGNLEQAVGGASEAITSGATAALGLAGLRARPAEATALAYPPEAIEIPPSAAAMLPRAAAEVAIPPKFRTVEQEARRAAIKAARPVVPETAAEAERGLSVIEEIRAKGADTKEKIRALFPQLSRETAAKLRDQAFPKAKIPDNLSKTEVDRLFLEKLNEQSNQEIQNASRQQEAAKVHGDVPPQSVEGVRQVPVEEGGRGVQPQTEGRVSEKAQAQPAVEDLAALQAEARADLAAELSEESKPPPIEPEAAPPTEAPTTAAVSAAKEGVGETAPSPSAIPKPSISETTPQASPTGLESIPENTEPIPELRAFEYHPGDFQRGLPVYSHPGARSELARRFGIPNEVGNGPPGSKENYRLFVNKQGRPIALWRERQTSPEPLGGTEVKPTAEPTPTPPAQVEGGGAPLTQAAVRGTVPRERGVPSQRTEAGLPPSPEAAAARQPGQVPAEAGAIRPSGAGAGAAELGGRSPEKGNPPVAPRTVKELQEQFVAANQGRVNPEQAQALTSLVEGVAKYKNLSPDEYVRQRFSGVVQGGEPAADALWKWSTRKPEEVQRLKDYLAKERLGKDFDDYVEQAVRYLDDIDRRKVGTSALRTNEKTLLAVDISGNCPLREAGTPCIFCYVEVPRTMEQVGIPRPLSPNKVFDSAAYQSTDILQMPRHLVDFLNDKLGGLRVFSTGDFKAADIATLDKIVTDAKKVGLRLKIITKQPEALARYRGQQHVAFNLSAELDPRNSDILSETAFQRMVDDGIDPVTARRGAEKLKAVLSDPAARKLVGYGWDINAARKSIANNPRATVRYVAVNRADAIRAIADPRIGVVTMYHGISNPELMMRVWDKQNPYIREQLGPETYRALASVFEAPKVQKFAGSVTAEELKAALGDRPITIDQFEKLAARKFCCQTGRCSNCVVGCGFQKGDAIRVLGKMLDGEPLASIEFDSDNRAVIRAFSKSNVSAMAHELGHAFRRDLDPADLALVEKNLGVENGRWDRTQEEQWANGFERYLRDGKAPTPLLARVFEQFKSWLRDIYTRLKGSSIDVKINPELRDVMDRMLGKEQPPQAPGMSVGPGAAAAGEPGSYSAIEQLSDRLRTVPSTAKANPLSWREKAADLMTAGRSAFAKVVGRARAVSETMKEAGRGIRDVNDTERAVGVLDRELQTSSGESRNLGKVMERTYKDANMRRAAALYIDAGGNVQQFRDALAHGLPENTRPEVRRAIETVANMPEEGKALADFLREYYGIREKDAVSADIFKEGLEDYFTHVWKREASMPDKLRMAITTGKVNTYWQFARQRKLSTFLEGIMEGKTPELDPAKVVPYYNFTLDRAIASRAFIRRLSDLKMSDGRDALAPTGTRMEVERGTADETSFIRPRAKPESIGDYRSVDHPALRKWKWAGTNEAGNPTFYQSDLLVHPELYERLARIMERSRLTPAKVTRAALRVGSEMKSAKFGLASTFHQIHVGLHAAFHWADPFMLKTKPWVQPDGLINFRHPFVQDAIEKGHLKVAADPHELNLMSEGILNHGALIHKIPFVGPWSRVYSEWLFTNYIPKLKLATYEAALPRNLKHFAGKLTEEQVKARVGDAVNSAYGELNRLFLGKYGRDPRFQRALQLGFLAPDFGEARLRFVGKALTKAGYEERLALVTMFTTLYTTARIANYLSHGNPEWDWKKAFSVKAGDHWFSVRSVIGDVDHALADFVQFATVRLSPASRTILEVFSKRDAKGQKRTGSEQVGDFMRQFLPISLQGVAEPERAMWESFSGAMGLSARKENAEQEVRTMVREWMKKSRDPAIQARIARIQKETFAPSEYAGLRRKLKDHDNEGAQAEYKKLRKTKTPQMIETAMRPTRPLAGSYKIELEFRRSMTPAQRSIYNRAKREREQQYERFLTLSR